MNELPFHRLYELTRGGIVESLHLGAVAVADTRGRRRAWLGDPQVVVFLRSSAKPFQTLPLVESGGWARAGFSSRELALTCASHIGLDMHAETAAAMQAKAGVREADLLCGVHPLSDADTVKRLTLAGQPVTSNRHNCSGKHTGMLTQARLRGLPLEDYVNPRHGIQQTILQGFAEMCGLPPEQVVVGIDGCSAPNFAVPLENAAAAFARLADPSSLAGPRAAALRSIFDAMTSHPEMVRGPGGFDTELMRLKPGRVVSKGGAEGYHAIGLVPGALGPGSPALGITLKVADGQGRAAEAAALEVLRQLGFLGPAELDALAGFGYAPRRPLHNFRGLEVGEGRTCFRLDTDGSLELAA